MDLSQKIEGEISPDKKNRWCVKCDMYHPRYLVCFEYSEYVKNLVRTDYSINGKYINTEYNTYTTHIYGGYTFNEAIRWTNETVFREIRF